jgi:hypothetical protein
MSIGVYAQDSNPQSLAESSKATATKISQELKLDDDRSLLLYRAIYSTELGRARAENNLSDDPEQLASTNKKIDESFVKILEGNFSEKEIAKIKQLYKTKKK